MDGDQMRHGAQRDPEHSGACKGHGHQGPDPDADEETESEFVHMV